MQDNKLPEVWQRGPISGISPLLQPAIHAILQAKEEIAAALQDFPEELLWTQPAGLASVGFHLQHITGVLDRLFTYAKGGSLTEQQMGALQAEGKPSPELATAGLLNNLFLQIDKATLQLKDTTEEMLLLPRGIGRKQLPTNVIGLLFHAAEHTQRHTGQLLVTAKIVAVKS